ncbi:MAG: glutathione peroxidase [Flavobacterium sp.]|nr:MAG: glutathione peroxidase [Flavobacterium sp.]
MKNAFFAIISALALVAPNCSTQAQKLTATGTKTKDMVASIYDFKVKDLSGKEFDFSKLRGKKVLIVNTASECGFTPQYKDLELLYERFKDKNLVIVGFPANDFGAQEPGTNAEIATFCQKNYGVTFPMMGKSSVKGKDMNPVYQYLTKKDLNGYKDSTVDWNFQKYLINENGKLVMVVPSKVSPLDDSIVNWVNKKD